MCYKRNIYSYLSGVSQYKKEGLGGYALKVLILQSKELTLKVAQCTTLGGRGIINGAH